MEEWKPVSGFEDYYAVSSRGDIMGIAPRSRKGRGAIVGKVLRVTSRPDGYLQVTLRADRRRRTVQIHIAVCEAFHGPAPSPFHEVAHWDGKRSNNTPRNLRWATRPENVADRARHGRNTSGTRCHFAKLSEADVIDIRKRAAAGCTPSKIARHYRMSWNSVSDAIHRRSWAHVA